MSTIAHTNTPVFWSVKVSFYQSVSIVCCLVQSIDLLAGISVYISGVVGWLCSASWCLWHITTLECRRRLNVSEVGASNPYSIQDSSLGPQAQKSEAAQKFEFWRSEKNWLVQPQQHVSTWQQHILAYEVLRKNWMCFLHTFAAIQFNKEQYRTKLQ